MADTKISEMTAAVTAADADLVPIVQGGVNKKATVDLILDALTAARVATAIGSTAANLVYAGPASGASAVPAARSLVADDIPASLPLSKLAALTIDRALISSGAGVVAVSSVTATELGYVSGVTSAIQTQLGNKQPLDATLTALAALDGTVGFVRQTAADTFERTTDGSTLTGLNATNLASGTIPDDRFPAVLPAISGANLTNLPGGISGLTTGVVPAAGSGTSLEDSKMTTSGTNKGTWTLYDNGGAGVTSLVLQEGTNQSTTDYLLFADSAGANTAGIRRTADNVLNITDGAGGLGRLRVEGVNLDATMTVGFFGNGSGDIGIYSGVASQSRFKLTTDRFIAASDAGFQFTNTAADPGATVDLGMSRSAAGILKVTDGSTGWGSVRAAALGTQTANGAISNVRTISESITLATGGLTTDSSADLLPANSIILSVVARITTTITTTTNWALGDATTAARFAAANATLTAGTTTVGLAHQQGSVATDAAGPVQTAAAKLRITCSGANPGAGTIRVTVTYLELTPPSS